MSSQQIHFWALFFFLLRTTIKFTVAQEWTLVWQDEFEETDLENWNFEEGCGGFGNNELQCYVASRNDNARVENGILIISAILESWNDTINNRDFTSAKLTSKFNTTYGMFEIKARLPKGKHLWPAFWMMPTESVYGGWPSSGEIDIMEYRGQRPSDYIGTVHYGPSWDNKGAVGTGERNFSVDFSEDFHTFGFHWDEYAVRWLVDGQQFHSEGITKNFWPGFYEKDGQPFDRPFYFILNLAVGGTFFPPEWYGEFEPDDALEWEKNTLEIDYIRVYKWQ